MSAIVAVTLNPALDLEYRSRAGRAEAEASLRRAAPRCGGGGINVARAIRYLGGEAMAVFASGGPSR